MNEIVKKVHDSSRARSRRSSSSAAATSSARAPPGPRHGAGLVDLLDKDTDIEVRHQVARAIGFGGFDDKVQAQLFEKMEDVELRNDAALALILGGTTDAATKAVAMYADYPKEALDELKDVYYRSFGYWSDEDFARAASTAGSTRPKRSRSIRVKDTPQDWARLRLQAQFDNLDFDNGPHSMTRVVLRYRLCRTRRRATAPSKKGAIQTLKFMKEQGSLMALRDEPGETGQLAAKAFFELMNPKIVAGENIPELASTAAQRLPGK